MSKTLLQVVLHLVLLLFTGKAFSQEATVSGTIVSEEDNAPLSGVTVTNQRSGKKTVTTAAGYFSIAAQPKDVLELTYVGYARKEYTVGAETKVSIRLTSNREKLGDVVVTAYGIKREKKSLGYSTQVVAGEDIAQTRRENFINSLAGRVAGATITATSGTPGASSQIVLRGATSIGGNNQPLFVVDGVPYDNQTLNQEGLIGGQSVAFNNRNSDYGNRAMDINPEDIESLTILKGPEATALYGSDGASGAIVITTKKGKSGNVSVGYDNSFRFEKVYRFPEVQTEYTLGRNGVYDPNAVVNPYAIFGTGGGISAAFGPRMPAGKTTYDNVRNFFKTGFTQQHNLNIEGGNDISTYRFSTNYINQDGVVPRTGFDRATFKLTGSTRLGKLRISSFMNYVTSTTNKATKGSGGYLQNLLLWPVDNDVRNYMNPDGTKVTLRNISTYSLEYDNPLWDVNKNPSQDKVDRLTGNMNMTADVTPWLNLGAIFGIDYYTQYGFLATHPQSRYGYASNGFYSLYTQTTRNFSNTYRAVVNKKTGDFSHTFTAGFYFEDNKTKLESQKGERFYERDFYSINNTDPLSRDAKTTLTNIRKVRFFGNLVEGYKGFLYLSLAGSREGVSTFMSRVVDKDPFFNYGSSSLSFVFSDLPGVKTALPWLSFGKARISYATTGKGPYAPYVIDYKFANQITTGGGYAYDVTGNNFTLQPERSKNLEYGVELGAFNNRLKMDLAIYSLRSDKQLLAARASYGTGYVIKWFNGGEVENRGVEVQLTAIPVKTKNVYWESTINFDRNVGKIISMPADLPTYYDSDTWVFGNLRSQYFKGAKIGNLAANTYKRNNAGQILINPASGLPVRDEGFTTVGDRQPAYKFGWLNTFSYKSLTLSMNLDFRRGGSVFNGTEFLMYLTGYSKKTLNRDKPLVVNGVLQDGFENTATPTKNTMAITPLNNSDYYISSANAATATEEDFIENVNWIRMRDVTLSYSLPKSLLGKQRVFKSASVFFTGTDLFMITNYSGADPSVNANNAANRGFGGAGIDFGSLSTPRGFNFGCRVSL
ncbi:TonB-linked SusC/RagA family outer membrane protein [Filimonas zeae]|uniref:SusC/RagA family TonB-linked outer membrane protein n=1 Tax=Filimonas zeae TaxID=1737353 RepID=UPI0016663334|nr:SusC/RagA family TonB-linked outer membrane protein [Filimonas zeae]MDR6339612.1 TonB-linked SusC/RagA family outer membrane protein [Filimonas zeae]